MTEPHEHRLRRLQMRSMRRGIKEMDIILERFARANLGQMSDAELTQYDALLSENDHDLYQWVTGQMTAADPYEKLVKKIVDQLPENRG